MALITCIECNKSENEITLLTIRYTLYPVYVCVECYKVESWH